MVREVQQSEHHSIHEQRDRRAVTPFDRALHVAAERGFLHHTGNDRRHQ